MLLLGSQTLFAQIVISGTVTDKSGEPLPAILSVLVGKSVKGFGNADENGKYSISFSTDADSIAVKASMMGFSPSFKTVPAKTQRLDFDMEEADILLKEVSVVAEKISQKGDTLSFIVGAYKDENDRVIGDVIKKMPGLEVSDNGSISFNGKTIKNFYVEDMDLLQGRYGIATNNISANDVASVQVYQNHQQVRALKDWSPSEDVTINLKLKSSAKGVFTMTGMGGIGYKPMLWAAEATGMYFGKKGQSITTYKGNNSGDNVASEQENLTGDGGLQFFNQAPLGIVSPGTPGVKQKRYMRNRSNTLSTNNILKLDSLSTLSVSLSYIDDILRNEGSSVTEQYLPDGAYRTMSQTVETKNYVHKLSGGAVYKKNTDRIYAENRLDVNASWNKRNGINRLMTDFSNINQAVNQHLDNPAFSISDNANLIINSEANAWNLSFGAGWNHRPQKLSVSPASIFSDKPENDVVTQNYTSDDFRGQAETGYFMRFGKLTINTFIFGNVDIESVKSHFDGFDMSDFNTVNRYTFGKAEGGGEARIGYPISNSYFEVTLPLSYNGQWLRDKETVGRNREWNYLSFNPAIKYTYRLGKSWCGLNASYYKIRNNSDRAQSGVVMTDYLTFRESFVDHTLVDKSLYVTGEYHYSNAMAQLFANASASWQRSSCNTMVGYEYDGIATVKNAIEQPYVSNRYGASANVSKGMDFWESMLKVTGNYSLYKSMQLVNSLPVDYKSQYWSANLVYSAMPATWMGMALGLAYGENKSFTELNKDAAMSVRQCTGRLDLNFFPVRRLILNVAFEENYTNMTERGRYTWFGDAKITYKTGRFDWELEANNIFNRKLFSRVNYTDMDIYRSTYRLRPFNVMLKVRFNVF